MKPHKYGFCESHKNRENEYYDKLNNKAFCSLCAIGRAQERKLDSHGPIAIEEAYMQAQRKAETESTDATLEHRKQRITMQMDKISQKIATIKQ